jgi:uncharacterized protein (TIGR00369 family)
MKRELAKEAVEYAQSRMTLSKFSALMGFEVERLYEGGAVLGMDVGDRHRQVQSVMHGGVIAALADTAAALAAYTAVPKGTEIVTIELKINYLLPIRDGRVTAEGKVLRAGRNFLVVECEVYDAAGIIAAKALMTFGAAAGHSLPDGKAAKGARSKSVERKRIER